MADNTNQDNLSLEQDLIRLLQQRQGIGEGILDDSRDLANVLRDQTKSVQFQIIEKNKLRSIGREIVKIADQTYAIDKKDLGTQKSIADLAKQRQTLEKSLYALSSLQNKIYTEDKELNREINQSINDQIKNVQQLLIETGEVEKTSKAIADNFGVKMFGALSDISKAIPGLKRFSEPFDKAAEAAREVGAQNAINKKEFQDILNNNGKGLTKEKIKQLGLEKELGGLAGSAAAARAKSLGLQVKGQSTLLAGAKSLGPSLAKSFGPAMIIEELKDAFIKLDDSAGNTAKAMGISYSAATDLNSNFNAIANSSGNIFVTTKGINESFNQINAALGTNAALSNEILLSQTELVKQAFYSVEAATMLSKLSIATGKPTKEIAASFLGSAKALNIVNNTAINEKQLLEDISKLSKDTLATFADQPGKLAEAAYEARKLGLDLQKLKGTQDALLNIESSIAAEFEAEVITGKQLNLERARYFALTNDYAGLAKELGNQDITRASFAKMNVLQQESIAKAMGMSADTMGEMLMDQETMSKLSGIDGANAKEKFNNLVKQVGMEEAKKRLGDETLANQMQSASIQDRFNASIEKLKEVFVTVMQALMPIVDIFAAVFELLGPIMAILDPMIQTTLVGVAAIQDLINGIKWIFGGDNFSSATIKQIGKAEVSAQKNYGMNFGTTEAGRASRVEDGIAPSSKGPFTITDKYGATSGTTVGDGLYVSPNINTQSTPQQSSPIIDYERLGMVVAKAIAANPIQATTYFDMNEHGRRYQKATSGITTRKL
jgi:hypothetical protein